MFLSGCLRDLSIGGLVYFIWVVQLDGGIGHSVHLNSGTPEIVLKLNEVGKVKLIVSFLFGFLDFLVLNLGS